MLDNLGFSWDPNLEAWNIGYRKLQQFKERNGHCNVTARYIEGDMKLGFWVSTQRQTKDTFLSADRIQKLDDLGFVWEAREKSN